MLNNEKEDSEEIKVILVGNVGVGKTNLINTITGKEFTDKVDSTISPTYSIKRFEIEGIKFTLNLWDTAGQERYLNVTKLFFKGSGFVIFVYDITNYKSYESLRKWYEISQNIIETDHICAIVGNKSDLILNKKVNEEEAENYAKSINAKFKIVSAKEQSQLFIDLLEEMILEYKNKKYNINNRRKSMKLNNNNKNNKNHSNCC